MKGPCKAIQISPSVLYYGTPVAIISTLNQDGTTNLSPMSSAWALGYRVILGLGQEGQAFHNLSRCPECVINLPSPELWQNVERLAPTTGRNPVPAYKQAMGFRFEPDKFEVAGLTPVDAAVVQPKRVAECPLQLEARILATHYTSYVEGDDDHGTPIIETRVERVWAHPDIVVPGTHRINTERWSPLLYVWRHYFGTAERLGRSFRDVRE